MKLFTSEINNKLFKQYPLGNDLDKQKVVAKLFNPYGNGRWFLLNSDPNDPNYLWAIVEMGGEVEIGSVSRNELESIRVTKWRLPIERDLSFSPKNAKEVYDGLLQGKHFAKGGSVADSNKEMLLNQAEEFEHHAEEFESAVEKSDEIPAWVVAKSQRASTDLSDITHYLDGENEQKREMKEGEEYAKGGKVGHKFKYQGKDAEILGTKKIDGKKAYFVRVYDYLPNGDMMHTILYDEDIQKMAKGGKLDIAKIKEEYEENEDNNAHSENVVLLAKHFGSESDLRDAKIILSKHEAIGNLPPYLMKERDELSSKLYKKMVQASHGKMANGGYMENGGEAEEGVDLFEDYDEIPPNVQSILDKHPEAFEDGDYRKLEKALKELNNIGYTFEYELDGQAYDLRKIGQKGKSEYMADGGYMAKGGQISGTFKFIVYKTEGNNFVSTQLKGVSPNNVMIKGVEGKLKGNDYNSAENVAYVILDEHDYIDRVEIIKVGASVLKNKKVAAINRDKEDKNRFSIDYYADGGYMEKGGSVWEKNGFIEYKRESPREWQNVEWSLNGHSPSFKGKMYFQKGSGFMFIEKENGEIYEPKSSNKLFWRPIDKMAMGGVTFDDKVKAVKSSLLKRKKVSPSVQKDYGKIYSPKEAEDSAKRIVGAMTAAERLKAKSKKYKDGGLLANGKYRYFKGDEGMYQGDEVRVYKFEVANGYTYDILDENGKPKNHGFAKTERFHRDFRYFPKVSKSKK